MHYDPGRMEDYVFHEIGKARATIRAHSILFTDISDIWESIRENDADSAAS
jgi:hypothetical protein